MPAKKSFKNSVKKAAARTVAKSAKNAKPAVPTKVASKSVASKLARSKHTAAKSFTAKTPAARVSLSEVMTILEKLGTEQTRKTWARHGATEPMFGVLFGELFKLMKRIDVDHELAQ